jgi:hypothetical protein
MIAFFDAATRAASLPRCHNEHMFVRAIMQGNLFAPAARGMLIAASP